MRTDIVAALIRLKKTTKKLQEVEEELGNITNSASYKIGRHITKYIRAIFKVRETIQTSIGKIKNTGQKKYPTYGNTNANANATTKKPKNKGATNLKTPNTNRNSKLIISLTSFPERIDYLYLNLCSLLNQTLKPDLIYLWLAEDEYPNKENNLPQNILNLRDKGLTINWCDNLKSYKKLIYTLKNHPQDLIISADDDIYYPEKWLELLYISYLQEPGIIHCHRAHQVKFNDTGNIKSYNEWPDCITTEKTSYLNFFTTGGGVLFPPETLYKDALNKELFLHLCPTSDDIWFWAMAILNKTKIKVVDNNINHITAINPECEDTDTKATTLYQINKTQNDINIKRLISHYEENIIELIMESI